MSSSRTASIAAQPKSASPQHHSTTAPHASCAKYLHEALEKEGKVGTVFDNGMVGTDRNEDLAV